MYIIYISIFLSSILLTFLVRQLALKKNIIDNPNERSSHTVPTPRGGGLAIVITWFAGLVFLFWQKQIEANLFYALLSGIVLAVVSALDDVLDLTPKVRMIAQAVSAAGALYFLGGFNLLPDFDNVFIPNSFGIWIFSFCAFIGIIWFINLYNFLDGIDAYASQEAILVTAGLLLLTGNYWLGILIAAVGGFLVWNWPKAKIFMGDVGSTQLGFALVVLGIYFHNQQELNILTWLALTSVFWFDATITLYRRWRNKEQLSKAHKKHMYQRLNQSGLSHLQVDLLAIAFNVFVVALAWLNQRYSNNSIVLLIIVVVLLFTILRWVDSRKAFSKD